jgi:hypothetical protein
MDARATGNGNFTSLARDSSQLREAHDCNLWNATSSQHEHDVMAIGYPAFHTEAIMHEVCGTCRKSLSGRVDLENSQPNLLAR